MTHIAEGSSTKSRQLRAARTLLDWSQEKLAKTCNLSVATIRKLEMGFISRHKTLHLVQRALESAGLEFIEPGGVRRRHDDVIMYQGLDGAIAFFDDVYQTSKKKGEEIVAVCSSEAILLPSSESEATIHVERMSRIHSKAPIKCILTQDVGQARGHSYIEYRTLPKYYVDPVPFLAYGDKYVITVLGKDPVFNIMVVRSNIIAQAFRRQFQSMWEKAIPLAESSIQRSTGKA